MGHSTQFFHDIETLPGAKEGLEALKERYELHLVTSRQTDIEQDTRSYIDKHFPGIFDGMNFGNHFGVSGKKTSKPEMCKQINAVGLLDDSLDYARQCSEVGIPTYVFGEYGWNRTPDG